MINLKTDYGVETYYVKIGYVHSSFTLSDIVASIRLSNCTGDPRSSTGDISRNI